MTGQRVAISGATGLIGSALSSYLVARGDDVRHLVRREARTGSEISWDPDQRRLDPADLEGVAIHFYRADKSMTRRLFADADSGQPSVVYRRKGYDYGVIRLVS